MTTAGRRPGISLTEVLVALFLMGIGTIAILTLFPLGALNMAAAFRDDRTSQSASQADSYMRFYWQAEVIGPRTDVLATGLPNTATTPDPFTDAFLNPNAGVPASFQVANQATTIPVPVGDEPSYPVFVDPMRFAATDNAQRYWAGFDQPSARYQRLARRNLSPTTNTTTGTRTAMPGLQALRTCSLLDGLTFDPAQGGRAGDPSNAAAPPPEREYRYNWLWVLQLPRQSDPDTATLSIVVYDKRTYQFVPETSEYAYSGVTFTPESSTLPPVPIVPGVIITKGSWVMDATVTPAAGVQPAIRHAKFYQVVSATENTAGFYDIELDRPVTRLDGRPEAYTGTLVVLNGVAEVFERANLTP